MNFENKTHFEKRVANRSCARFISCCEKIEVTLLYILAHPRVQRPHKCELKHRGKLTSNADKKGIY